MKETKYKKAIGALDEDKSYSTEEALELILKQPKRKFQETVDISVWLGIDPKKSEQNIRGSLTLPNSLGKEVKVAAFVDSDKADEAKKGGADFIGLDDLIEKYKDGNIDFDVAITTPDQMKNVSKLAKVLGPRTFASLLTTFIIDGVVTATSKSIFPSLYFSIRSSVPIKSAPASFASAALSSSTKTATLISLPKE